MKKPLLIIPVVAVAAVAVAMVAWPRGGTAVEKDKAVTDYRQNSSTGDKPKIESTDEAKVKAPSIPATGVYAYSAVGQEEVKLGPFPADTRVFPTEIVASVTDDPAAASTTGAKGERCFDYELNLIAEHVEKTTYCAQAVKDSKDSNGFQLTIAAHTKNMKMGPASPVATLACDPVIVIAQGVNKSDIPCTLKLGGGPMEVNAEMKGTLTVGAPEAIDVGGTSVQASLVSITYLAAGKVSGPWSEKIWMSVDNWLPVKIVRDVNLQGPASIRETSELTLKSLEPTT